MTAKEYLRRLGIIDRAIRSRMKHLADMKADVSYIKGMNYDSVHVQTSARGESFAQKQVEEIADLEAKVTKELAEYHQLRHKIITEIGQLPDLRYQELLTMRYVDGMSLQDIADEMGYTYEWVRELHGWALLLFEAKFLNNLQNLTYKTD